MSELSDSGLAVGFYSSARTGHVAHAVAWLDRSLIELPGSAAEPGEALAYAVNRTGTIIAGIVVGEEQESELVRWDLIDDDWQMTPLGITSARPTDVNDRGQIVGHVIEDEDLKSRDQRRLPFLWEDGNLVMLPVLPDNDLTRYAVPVAQINDSGWIVGSIRLSKERSDEATIRGVVWRDLEITELEALGGESSIANGLNSIGQIVGWAETGDGVTHACMWENGAPRDLNDLLPASLGITLGSGLAINDHGVILARTNETKTSRNLVLLIPSPLREQLLGEHLMVARILQPPFTVLLMTALAGCRINPSSHSCSHRISVGDEIAMGRAG